MRSFRQLFAGRTDCYGIYHLGEVTTEKKKGRGQTKRENLSDTLWSDHLEGRTMLGIVPVRPDGTVGWFACDIDKYDLDVVALDKKCQSLDLPLVVCRSKSGGAHCYCFINGAAPAGEAITLMKLWIGLLGYPKAEIFPKQEKVTEQSVGNWINLPYFGGDKTDRYAIGINGERLSLEEFEQLASARSLKPEELKQYFKPQKEERDWKLDAPPCVVTMAEDGVGEGGRNNALIHISIYLRKAYGRDGDGWKDKVSEFNADYFNPPVPFSELQQVIRNASVRNYEYMCKTEPMCSICQKDECLKRKWGVGPQRGTEYDTVEVSHVTKILSDPPIFILTINGDNVRFSTEQLMSPSKFRHRVVESLNLVISPRKQLEHDKDVTSWLKSTQFEVAPEEISVPGQIKDKFYEWCANLIPRMNGSKALKQGCPFWDKDQSEIIFRGNDFISSLRDSLKGRPIPTNEIWDALRDLGCVPGNRRVDGEQVKIWKLKTDNPWFELPKEEQF